MKNTPLPATVAEIQEDSFKKNLLCVKNALGSNVKICLSVKADSYGHGAINCAKIACDFGIEYLSVARVFEGEELRNAGIKNPILLLSIASDEEIPKIIENSLVPLVFSSNYIEKIANAAKNLNKKNFPVHLAIDTGMKRIGCCAEDAGVVAKKIIDSGLFLEGVCTHFAVSDSSSEKDREFTKNQGKNFLYAIENIKKIGIQEGIRHCASSAAIFEYPEFHFDMVRPGIVAYGYFPGDFSREYFLKKGELKKLFPVMTLKTKVSAIKKIFKGESVSYGRTWTSPKNGEIATLPIGYADGLFRALSGKFSISIGGKAFPQVGRICMDQTMVFLGENSGIKIGDEAIIFGNKEQNAILDANDISKIIGTIPYEITCAVSKRVPRVWLKNN